MRAIWMTAAALILALAGAAQAQAPAQPQPLPPIPTTVFASSADVQAMIATARKMHKPGESAGGAHILYLAPYNANLEYRTAVGPAAIHEKEAEFFYVIDGSGALTTGGKLVGEKRLNPDNLSGAGIDGGQSRPVAKGDILVVPQGVPHWFNAINGELILMSLHVPRG